MASVVRFLLIITIYHLPCIAQIHTFRCTGEDMCKSTTMICTTNLPCAVICDGKASCIDANIVGNGATELTVSCNGVDACKPATIQCGNGPCSLYCMDGTTVCNGINVNIDTATSFQCYDQCPPDILNIAFTSNPTQSPTKNPASSPTFYPITIPPTTKYPTNIPTINPSKFPSITPTTFQPTIYPTNIPTLSPTNNPTHFPSSTPTIKPTSNPIINPTYTPTNNPSYIPTQTPTLVLTTKPTAFPSISPTTYHPSKLPTKSPTNHPTMHPVSLSTINPSESPTKSPTDHPTRDPTESPTAMPSVDPSIAPTNFPLISSTTIGPSIKMTMTTPIPTRPYKHDTNATNTTIIDIKNPNKNIKNATIIQRLESIHVLWYICGVLLIILCCSLCIFIGFCISVRTKMKPLPPYDEYDDYDEKPCKMELVPTASGVFNPNPDEFSSTKSTRSRNSNAASSTESNDGLIEGISKKRHKNTTYSSKHSEENITLEMLKQIDTSPDTNNNSQYTDYFSDNDEDKEEEKQSTSSLNKLPLRNLPYPININLLSQNHTSLPWQPTANSNISINTTNTVSTFPTVPTTPRNVSNPFIIESINEEHGNQNENKYENQHGNQHGNEEKVEIPPDIEIDIEVDIDNIDNQYLYDDIWDKLREQRYIDKQNNIKLRESISLWSDSNGTMKMEEEEVNNNEYKHLLSALISPKGIDLPPVHNPALHQIRSDETLNMNDPLTPPTLPNITTNSTLQHQSIFSIPLSQNTALSVATFDKEPSYKGPSPVLTYNETTNMLLQNIGIK